MNRRRVAVYGDVDLNYIDGSSVWLVSLCSVLVLIPDLEVELVLKSPVRRKVLTAELPDGILIHEPTSRRDHQAAMEALSQIDEKERLDFVIVRGRELASRIVAESHLRSRLWAYLTDVPQRDQDLGEESEKQLRSILDGAHRILCQTEDMRAWFTSLVPHCDSKLLLLPPMIPDDAFRAHRRGWRNNGLRLLYAGKFAPDWGFLEVVGQLSQFSKSGVDVSLIVAGDKIHDPPDDPSFAREVQDALNDPIVDWRGGVSRSGVFALLDEVDLALSVRSHALDESRELSTKILEYAAAGVPVVANRTRMHVELFGEDYPFLVNEFDELQRVLQVAHSSDEVLDWASESVATVANEYSYKSIAADLDLALSEGLSGGSKSVRSRGILVAGHDLRFITPLMEGWVAEGNTVLTDQWLGHDRHDPARSLSLLSRAELVVCEWMLGNSHFYARAVPEGVPLVVRLHRMEVDTEWPSSLSVEAVSRVVVVSEHLKQRLVTQFHFPEEKVQVIPNGVDVATLWRPKLPGAEFNLGLLGYLPKLKRLDRSVNLLRILREHDSRYRLLVRGKSPDELDWVWGDHDQRSYYNAIEQEIAANPDLADAIAFEPAGPDIPSWFRKVGYVLSPSDVESFHLAMVEGMASGAVPVVWEREGASDLVDPKWVHRSTQDAARWILEHSGNHRESGASARAFVLARYSMSTARKQWRALIDDLTFSPTDRRSSEVGIGASLPAGTLMATQLVANLRSIVTAERSPPLSYPYRYRWHHPDEEDMSAVETLREGKFRPSPLFPAVDLGFPPDWRRDPFDNRTWDFHRHSLEWLEPIIRASATSDDALELLAAVVNSWIEENSELPGGTRYVWNDHSAAIRTRVLLFLIHTLDRFERWQHVDRELVVASLVQHGAFLADPANYVANSNHGLEVAASLLALSVSLPEIRYSREWRRVAEQRLTAYVSHNFSQRAVHMEQSPAYHLFVTVRLMSVVAFMHRNGFAIPEEVSKTVRAASAVWPYFRRPDGSTPMVGDTPLYSKPIHFNNVHEQLLGYKPRAIAPEHQLNPREDGASAFVDAESGFAVYADLAPTVEPQSDRRSFQVVVKCNTFESPHSHRDAGSLVVWWEGREWLVDSGYYSMEERTEERQYMRSPRAHNVVMVDGGDFDVKGFSVAEIFRGEEGDGVDMLHEMDGVTHRRRVAVSAVRRRVSILDEIWVLDKKAHVAAQMFHLHPETRLRVVEGDGAVVEMNGSRLVISRTRRDRVEAFRGDHQGQAVAWYSPEYMRREPSNLLRWSWQVERHSVVVTELEFLPR